MPRNISALMLYPLSVLSINSGVAGIMVALMCVHRRGGSMGHLNIGVGLHAGLRLSLSSLELVSSLFRPLSLSLRLVCNSVAGHILLGVLLDMLASSRIWMFLLMIGAPVDDVRLYTG